MKTDELILPSPAVPEGWQLVPVEPTLGMLRAAVSREGLDPQHYGRIRDTFIAMLAAAPKPETRK